MLAEIQDLVLVQMIVYHWVVTLSLLILSSSSFLINIILELWIVAKRKPAYVAYITAMIFLQIIPHSIFHIFIISWVYNEPIQWPAPSWLVSLIGRALHWYRRGQGFESHTSLSFFRLSFRNCISCVYNCNDLPSINYIGRWHKRTHTAVQKE